MRSGGRNVGVPLLACPLCRRLESWDRFVYAVTWNETGVCRAGNVSFFWLPLDRKCKEKVFQATANGRGPALRFVPGCC